MKRYTHIYTHIYNWSCQPIAQDVWRFIKKYFKSSERGFYLFALNKNAIGFCLRFLFNEALEFRTQCRVHRTKLVFPRNARKASHTKWIPFRSPVFDEKRKSCFISRIALFWQISRNNYNLRTVLKRVSPIITNWRTRFLRN